MKRCIRDILRTISEEPAEGETCTKLELLCRRIFDRALDGERWAAEWIGNRLEGRPEQRVEVKDVESRNVLQRLMDLDEAEAEEVLQRLEDGLEEVSTR